MSDLQQEIILEPQTSHYQYYARILNLHQKIIMQTPNMNEIITQDQFAPTQNLNEVSNLKKYDHQHSQYSLMAMTIPYDGNQYTIQVALNSSHTKELISKYQNFLWLLLFINIFFSVLIGTLVTKHGLKPINKLNRLLNTLQSNQLNLQLDSNSWPTELQQTIKGLNSMLARIDNAFNRLKDFSSDIAHELRTPLNNVICQNEVTLGKTRNTEEYINVLASTIEECQKMAKLIDDMLLIARSNNPYYSLKNETIPLHSLVDDTINYLQLMADDKNIKINVEGNAFIRGDALLLKRALINLLVNSIHYSKPNQPIDITIKENEIAHQSSLIIQDSGIGIDAKDLPYIFDRFYRADPSRSKTVGGTGLGLAIVKSIIQLHHAKINIQSELNKGTRVEITFKK